MENPFFVMTLSGTLAFLLYKMSYPFARKHFQPKWRYIFLKIVLLFYLMPIPMLLNWTWGAIKDFIQARRGSVDIMIPVDKFAETIVIRTNLVVSSPYFVVLLYVSIGLGTVSFLTLCFQILNYIWEKRECLHSGYDLPQNQFQEDITAILLKQKIRFMASPKARTPFVIGVLTPVIVLPPKMLDADRQTASMCIRHELMHIKKGDLLYRLLVLTAVCVHWFNPACYEFRKELTIVSEICCDHEVLKTIQPRQRKLYYNTLLSMTESLRPKFKNKFLSTFANENRIELKRRILELEVIGGSKREWLAALVCVAVFSAGIIGALAYTPYPILDPVFSINNNLTVFGPDISSIIDDVPQHPQAGSGQDSSGGLTIFDPNASSATDTFPPLPFACYFADESGAVYEANLGLESQSCIHEFVSGTIVEHIGLSKNECMAASYKGKRCVSCGFVVQGDCIYQSGPKECNHDFVDVGGEG